MAPLDKFTAGGKTVEVFGGAGPIVYLNGFEGEGEKIYDALTSGGAGELTLAAVSGLDWDRDLAPWDAPPIRRGGGAFTGGAGAYLELLTGEILPRAEAGRAVPWRGVAGYSLAGLFALWAVFETDVFSRAASASGSLWFPGFDAFASSRPLPDTLRRVYLSLGGREHLTRNPALRPVRERTEAMYALLAARGVETELVWNPGDHFTDPEGRMAAGIRWLLGENT